MFFSTCIVSVNAVRVASIVSQGGTSGRKRRATTDIHCVVHIGNQNDDDPENPAYSYAEVKTMAGKISEVILII